MAARRGRRRDLVPILCLGVFAVVWIVCAIRPLDRADWFLENLLTLIAVPTAALTYRGFRFSDQSYVQATLFLILHTLGSNYIYAEVPARHSVRHAFGLHPTH